MKRNLYKSRKAFNLLAHENVFCKFINKARLFKKTSPILIWENTKVKYNRHLTKIISVIKLEKTVVMITLRRPSRAHEGFLIT